MLAAEGQLAGIHAVQNDAQRVNVGGDGDRFACNLFWSHVKGRADGDAHRQFAGGIQDTRDPEIGDEQRAVFVDQDIGGLQIAVNDAFVMGEMQRRRQRGQVGERIVRFERLGGIGQNRFRASGRGCNPSE